MLSVFTSDILDYFKMSTSMIKGVGLGLSIVVVPLASHAVFFKDRDLFQSIEEDHLPSINACLVKMKSRKEKRSSPGQKRGVWGQT